MQTIDSLRGLYVKSPRWLRKSTSPFLTLLPTYYKYGQTYDKFRSLILKSEIDSDFVRDFQINKLRDIVNKCIRNSEFYQGIFQDIFGVISDISEFSWEDLQQLPILKKDIVRENPNSFLVIEKSRADLISTSGSSGKPLSFYVDKDRSVKEWAYLNHIWSRIGYRPSHRRAVLRGVMMPNVDVQPWEYDAAMSELRLSPFHLTPNVMERYLNLIYKYKINFIHGYPSAITILAEHAQKIDWQPPEYLLGVLPISERLFLHQREMLQNAFGKQLSIMPVYGLSEKVAIAGGVLGEPDTYEFEPLYGFTELVNDAGQPITTPGEYGRIISTGFLSEAMPLLRYDTGDTGILVDIPSSENCFRLRVRGIRSRRGNEFLVSHTGALISMTAINIHSKAYIGIQEFQFFQDTPGEATIKVVPFPKQKYADIEPFLQEIQTKVGSSIKFKLNLVDSLYANSRGKRSFIDQKLDFIDIK